MRDSTVFDDFDAGERRDGEPAFVVDVDGYEGPLDLLLDLARRQKVDLARVSILALAEQYIAFIESARAKRLELAADYLVMAAWLAYLKSRLLLPEPPKPEEPSAEEMADELAARLVRLEVVRLAAWRLEGRDRLHRDVFPRGAPEPIELVARSAYHATLHELLVAYGRQRQKEVVARVTLRKRRVWSLLDARQALERLVGAVRDWTTLDQYLFEFMIEPGMRATIVASSLSATLEMVREGRLALRQDEPFGRIWIRPGEGPGRG
ncbi:segregation and condensation protein A [Salinarimonas soli]|uniref:Segregation and condensation protein A n=1 Tax=Salinarimonas soli TaxID=1638099 RepID=A0A5B2V797_9HYPH|nr:ScpA family protein [Salinarimonas soli]KAA2235363.1 segregation/condensation protein A [Salinarimonas soli]